jgi:hypothetical protein
MIRLTVAILVFATMTAAEAADDWLPKPGSVTPRELRARVAVPKGCDLVPDAKGWMCWLAAKPGLTAVLFLDDFIPAVHNVVRSEEQTLKMLRMQALGRSHLKGNVSDWQPNTLPAGDRPERADACLVNDWTGDFKKQTWRSREIVCVRWIAKDLPQVLRVEVVELGGAGAGKLPIDIGKTAVEIVRRSYFPAAPKELAMPPSSTLPPTIGRSAR